MNVRHVEVTMAERGVEVDHSVHRGAIRLLPVIAKAFHRCKRPVEKSWRVDEAHIEIKGQ